MSASSSNSSWQHPFVDVCRQYKVTMSLQERVDRENAARKGNGAKLRAPKASDVSALGNCKEVMNVSLLCFGCGDREQACVARARACKERGTGPTKPTLFQTTRN